MVRTMHLGKNMYQNIEDLLRTDISLEYFWSSGKRYVQPSVFPYPWEEFLL